MKQDKDKGKQLIRNSTAEFLIFTGQAGEQSIEARYEDETIWNALPEAARLWRKGGTSDLSLLESIADKDALDAYKTWLQSDTNRQRPYYWSDGRRNAPFSANSGGRICCLILFSQTQ